MSYTYFVTDPSGVVHRALNQPALNAVFREIEARFDSDAEFEIYAVVSHDTDTPAQKSEVAA